jgi:hypothetical protein
MDTPRHDIEIHQGATFSLGFAYLDPAGVPIDLTGWTARMQVRDRVGGKVLADLSTENGSITIDPLVGRLQVTIARTVTRQMPTGLAIYDLFIVSPDDFAIKFLEGEVKVVGSVTRG